MDMRSAQSTAHSQYTQYITKYGYIAIELSGGISMSSLRPLRCFAPLCFASPAALSLRCALSHACVLARFAALTPPFACLRKLLRNCPTPWLSSRSQHRCGAASKPSPAVGLPAGLWLG